MFLGAGVLIWGDLSLIIFFMLDKQLWNKLCSLLKVFDNISTKRNIWGQNDSKESAHYSEIMRENQQGEKRANTLVRAFGSVPASLLLSKSTSGRWQQRKKWSQEFGDILTAKLILKRD